MHYEHVIEIFQECLTTASNSPWLEKSKSIYKNPKYIKKLKCHPVHGTILPLNLTSLSFISAIQCFNAKDSFALRVLKR